MPGCALPPPYDDGQAACVSCSHSNPLGPAFPGTYEGVVLAKSSARALLERHGVCKETCPQGGVLFNEKETVV